jgi:phage terminase small subunit
MSGRVFFMKKQLPVNIDDLGLTPREVKFVCEYITNGYIAEEAAKTSGLLPDNAGSVATRLHCSKLLSDERIKTAIGRTKQSFTEPYKEIHYSKIQEQLEVRAFYDIADYYDSDGIPIPLDRIPLKKRYAIDDIKVFNAVDKNGQEHNVTTGYVLANKDKARAELRSLHEERKEDKPDNGNEDARRKVLDLIDVFSKGVRTGMKKSEIEEKPIAQEAPLLKAEDIAQKIKDGEYAIKKDR